MPSFYARSHLFLLESSLTCFEQSDK